MCHNLNLLKQICHEIWVKILLWGNFIEFINPCAIWQTVISCLTGFHFAVLYLYCLMTQSRILLQVVTMFAKGINLAATVNLVCKFDFEILMDFTTDETFSRYSHKSCEQYQSLSSYGSSIV